MISDGGAYLTITNVWNPESGRPSSRMMQDRHKLCLEYKRQTHRVFRNALFVKMMFTLELIAC